MGRFRSFVGTCPDGEVAPIPAVRLTRSVGSSRPLWAIPDRAGGSSGRGGSGRSHPAAGHV